MKRKRSAMMALLVVAAGLSGCASDGGNTPSPTISSGAMLRPNENVSGAWIYLAPGIDLRQYTSFIIEPVQIHRGPEASFGGVSPAQQQEIAQILADEMRRALSPPYAVVDRPRQGTARLRLTLVRVEPTVSGVATASRIVPIGAAVNVVRGASGGSGSFTGSVDVGSEVFDASNGQLVAAAVRRFGPPVFDIASTLSTMETARASSREAAQSFRAAVDRVQRQR